MFGSFEKWLSEVGWISFWMGIEHAWVGENLNSEIGDILKKDIDIKLDFLFYYVVFRCVLLCSNLNCFS